MSTAKWCYNNINNNNDNNLILWNISIIIERKFENYSKRWNNDDNTQNS